MFDYRTNRTPIERLSSIDVWLGFVRSTTPGITWRDKNFNHKQTRQASSLH